MTLVTGNGSQGRLKLKTFLSAGNSILKILHIGKYFPPYWGGVETYLRSLMRSLARRGIISLALVHQSDITFRSSHEHYSAGDQTLLVYRAAVWGRLVFTPLSPTFPWLLNRLIKQHQPDVLHIHMPNVSAFWALFLPKARKIPWIIQWHMDVLASEHSLGLRLFYRLYRPFEWAMLRRASAVIASSPPYLESSLPLRAFRHKCSVIPLGIEPPDIPRPGQVTQAGVAAQAGPLQVLAVGRLTYYKGFDCLVRAAAALDNVEVHLVGEGDEGEALKALVKRLGIVDKIVFHGHLSDAELARQFARCDCVCLPSIERTEAFGLVLLEAMSYGKATVIADVPGSGMGWIVDHGVTGMKTVVQDIEGLAAALRYLSHNRDKTAMLGANGREKFFRCFNIDRCTDETIRLYARVLHPG
jgi:glycosyltransferase involved in cell wall biosynthesis